MSPQVLFLWLPGIGGGETVVTMNDPIPIQPYRVFK